MRFRPINLGRWILWSGYAIVLAIAPLVFTQSFAITLLSQMGIAIVFALSYNMLFGQTGLLSFGHSVYSGLGAYLAVHALKSSAALPVSLLPLAGGVGGALVGIVLGYVTTRRAGTTFAMITLGIGEMVFACSLMFPGFFGGEGGITLDRAAGPPVLGISGWTLGPPIQVYWLIAVWCFLATAVMYAFTRTPLGRIANAVRDNPERAEFVGYDPVQVRYLVVIVAGFFAGIAGGLGAINYEIVNAENVGALRSAEVLIATFIGGAGFFFGPILGAIVYVLMAVAIGTVTQAWLLYLGLVFVLMVVHVPGGLASLVLMNLRMARYGQLRPLVPGYFALSGVTIVLLVGLTGLVEMTYHLAATGANPVIPLHGLAVDTSSGTPWVVFSGLVVLGAALYRTVWRHIRREWDEGESIIERKGMM